jgi:biotin carboxyl carrier protein
VRFQVAVAGRTFEIEVENEHLVRVNGRALYAGLEQVNGLPLYSLKLDDVPYLAFVREGEGGYEVEVEGGVYPVQVRVAQPGLASPRAGAAEREETAWQVNAPLAGTLLSVPVEVGQPVEAGQVVAVIESMKMQMELKSPRAGSVVGVEGRPGQDVEQDQVLVVLGVE